MINVGNTRDVSIRNYTSGIRFLVFFTAVLSCAVSMAEERVYGETVLSRERPELDPSGIPAGGFRLYPSMDLSEEYDDNIFADNSNAQDDAITLIKPGIAARSDWNTHALNFQADSIIGRYADNPDEDYEDYHAGIEGEIEIRRYSHLYLDAGYEKSHVKRDSPNDENGIEPTVFDVASASAAFEQKINRITGRLEFSAERRNYDDVDGTSGEINNDDQDRDEATASLRLAYEFYPHNEAFVRVSSGTADYKQRLDDNGVNRNSDGYQVDIGSDFRFSGVLFGQFFIGKLSRNFDDAALDSIKAISTGGQLTWIPTGLTTVNLSVSRETQTTIVDNNSGILSTRADLVVDHELLRNLLLRASAGTQNDQFEGDGREDDYLNLGFAATYMMNRNLYLSLDYEYENRDSNSAGGVDDFRRNSLAFTLRLQM